MTRPESGPACWNSAARLPQSTLRQLIGGECGGKANGLLRAAGLRAASAAALAGAHGARVSIPPGFVLGTDLFDRLAAEAGGAASCRERAPSEIAACFDAASLAPEHDRALETILDGLTGPLAVRSSSTHEDGEHSFAGLYQTLFLTNAGTRSERRSALERAVKGVLASTFNPDPDAYRRKHGLRVEDEHMAVLVQSMAGRRRGDLFYPLVAGVAFSKNHYPWTERLNRDDGVMRLVFGLGTRAVGRNYARVLSLTDVRLRPEGPSIPVILRYSQEVFDALDLESGGIVSLEAAEALAHGEDELHVIASVLEQEEYLCTSRLPLAPGERFVITFDPLVQSERFFPFVPAVRALLDTLERESGSAVDIEFALTLEGQGTLHLLQLRPLACRPEYRKVELEPAGPRVLLDSARALGNGILDEVRDLVVIAPADYRRDDPRVVTARLSRLNAELAGRRYALIGPGRWGSTNPALGVPVSYADISNAAVIVEVADGEFAPELSYGTHFFGDLVADGTLYLSVIPRRGDLLRLELLREVEAEPGLSPEHIRLTHGATVRVDGATHRGQIVLARTSTEEKRS